MSMFTNVAPELHPSAMPIDDDDVVDLTVGMMSQKSFAKLIRNELKTMIKQQTEKLEAHLDAVSALIAHVEAQYGRIDQWRSDSSVSSVGTLGQPKDVDGHSQESPVHPLPPPLPIQSSFTRTPQDSLVDIASAPNNVANADSHNFNSATDHRLKVALFGVEHDSEAIQSTELAEEKRMRHQRRSDEATVMKELRNPVQASQALVPEDQTSFHMSHTYYFMKADWLRNLPVGTKVLPRHDELKKRHLLHCENISFAKAVATSNYHRRYLIVSHPWLRKNCADPHGDQLAALIRYLKEDQDGQRVEFVWQDEQCMPQVNRLTGTRTRQEQEYFHSALKYVNMLYLGCDVLILFNSQYDSKFWCLYEAFLSMHECSREGILPTKLRPRYKIIPIDSAQYGSFAKKKGLIDTWSRITVEEAHNRLKREDIQVTNQNDKLNQLARLDSLEEDVRSIFRSIDALSVVNRSSSHIRPNSNLHQFQACLSDVTLKISRSPRFEYCTLVVILVYSLVTGLEVSLMAGHSDLISNGVFTFIHFLFMTFFTVELLVRLLAERELFFKNNDRIWNIFDLIVVLVSWPDMITDLIVRGNQSNFDPSFMRGIRVVRIVRVLRMIRSVKYFKQLRLMWSTLILARSPMLYGGLIIIGCNYMTAICIVQGVAESLTSCFDSARLDCHDELLYKRFGTIYRASLTLYAAPNGSYDWMELAQLLSEVDPLYFMIFLVHTFWMTYAVTNLMIVMFIEAGQQCSFNENSFMDQKRAEEIEKLFTELDEDESGLITWEEFEYLSQRPQVQKSLKVLGIRPEQPREIFKLVDGDRSRAIDSNEFMRGLMFLENRSVDRATLLLENCEMTEEIKRLLNQMSQKLLNLLDKKFGQDPLAQSHRKLSCVKR